MNSFRCLAVLAFTLFAADSAQAVTIRFEALLTGAQERPNPVPSPGSGFAVGLFDTDTNQLEVDVDWSGLTSNVIGGHIHRINNFNTLTGPIIVDLGVAGGPTGSDTFSGAAPANFLNDLSAGILYFNLHTTTYPAGEIRGDIPEPGTVLLLAGGLLGIAVLRRR